MKILAIIPFRKQSARIPEKIYKKIQGTELCVSVTSKVIHSLKSFDDIEVLAAVDDPQTRDLLLKCLKAENIIMTDPELPSGTDRVYAAALQYAQKKNISYSSLQAVINIQGDMPFLSESALAEFSKDLKNWDASKELILTPYESWPSDLDYKDLGNVKIATSQSDRALYFSRYPIPCSRNFDLKALKLHVGIYAFTPSALESFCKLPASPLEKLEGLEQLRALDAQIPILCKHVVCKADESFRGIDTPGDLEWAENFKTQNSQSKNSTGEISA